MNRSVGARRHRRPGQRQAARPHRPSGPPSRAIPPNGSRLASSTRRVPRRVVACLVLQMVIADKGDNMHERKRLCWALDCGKLSREVRTHAAQNERPAAAPRRGAGAAVKAGKDGRRCWQGEQDSQATGT
jgi:hypothetical protein